MQGSMAGPPTAPHRPRGAMHTEAAGSLARLHALQGLRGWHQWRWHGRCGTAPGTPHRRLTAEPMSTQRSPGQFPSGLPRSDALKRPASALQEGEQKRGRRGPSACCTHAGAASQSWCTKQPASTLQLESATCSSTSAQPASSREKELNRRQTWQCRTCTACRPAGRYVAPATSAVLCPRRAGLGPSAVAAGHWAMPRSSCGAALFSPPVLKLGGEVADGTDCTVLPPQR